MFRTSTEIFWETPFPIVANKNKLLHWHPRWFQFTFLKGKQSISVWLECFYCWNEKTWLYLRQPQYSIVVSVFSAVVIGSFSSLLSLTAIDNHNHTVVRVNWWLYADAYSSMLHANWRVHAVQWGLFITNLYHDKYSALCVCDLLREILRFECFSSMQSDNVQYTHMKCINRIEVQKTLNIGKVSLKKHCSFTMQLHLRIQLRPSTSLGKCPGGILPRCPNHLTFPRKGAAALGVLWQ